MGSVASSCDMSDPQPPAAVTPTMGSTKSAHEHEDAVEQIAISDGLEPADRRVIEDHCGPNQDAGNIARSEKRTESFAGCRELSGDVSRHHCNNDDERDETNGVTRVPKP